MRILVTGGAGFIGSNLTRRLVDAGHTVRIIDDFSTGSPTNLDGMDVDVSNASILDTRALSLAMAGCDSVVHLAAIPSVPRSVAAPLASHDANATGTLRVLKACAELGAHVTVASSSSVYGAAPGLPKVESMMPQPRSPYAVSKLATEAYAIAWQHTYGLQTIAFRFFNVYGPKQDAGHAYAAVIPSFLEAAIHGRPVPVHGDGRQTRDFTFVDSVTDILSQATTRRITSEMPVNLAFGSRRSLIEVLEQLESLLGHRIERAHVPQRAGDVRDSQADNTLLRSLFPDALETEFAVGLQRTVEWFRSRPYAG